VLKDEMAAAATCRAFGATVTGLPADGLAFAEIDGSNASPSGDPVEAR
jgi:hypothetical protein